MLVSPLPFPQSLLVNYTLKWIKYCIYSPYIYCQQLCVIQASGPTPSFCLSLLHRCTHRRTYLLWFQPLAQFEMWIPFQSSPFDHPVIFPPFYHCRHIYSAPCFTFSCSCPHLLWLCSSIWITTPVFPSTHLLTPPGFPVGKRGSDRQKGGGGGTGWDRGDQHECV